MSKPFKLSAELRGHESDVRAVCAGPEGTIVTSSRDCTARLWEMTETGEYVQKLIFAGAGGYVSSVAYCPPDKAFPDGLIITGATDKVIRVYNAQTADLLHTLLGHTNNITCFSVSPTNRLLSGSWDNTARIWQGQTCTATLEGHSMAVWAVLWLSDTTAITGSADKTVRMWVEGKCSNVINAHTDAVRGLALLPLNGFASCSNDGLIKTWDSTGTLQHELHGHTSFVYSVCGTAQANILASGGEDRRLCIWRGSELQQSLVHPATSVWSVAALANGDVVTGASDGIARVFTQDEQRVIAADLLKAHEQAVTATTVHTHQVGDLLKEDVPGPEVLRKAGTKEGQTRLVKQASGKIECYQWTGGAWEMMGEVVNAVSSNQKQLYQGIEYDYVFDVDVGEGPSLKLPYNARDNPYSAAQAFLEANELPATYLDQVADFIVTNTKGNVIGAAAAPADPFTGQSSYVPTPGNNELGMDNSSLDPFTGSAAHTAATLSSSHGTGQSASSLGLQGVARSSSVGQGQRTAKAPSSPSTYFPQQEYITFDTANVSGLVKKLRELNTDRSESQQLTESELDHVYSMANDFQEADMVTMTKLLAWPDTVLFPVLDLLRLVVLQSTGAKALAALEPQLQLLARLHTILSTTDQPTANVFLSLRYLANAFSHLETRSFLSSQSQALLTTLALSHTHGHRNVIMAVATVYLNYAVWLQHQRGMLQCKAHVLGNCVLLMSTVEDPETLFRALVAVGTLVSTDRDALDHARGLDLNALLGSVCNNQVEKVALCAGDIKRLL